MNSRPRPLADLDQHQTQTGRPYRNPRARTSQQGAAAHTDSPHDDGQHTHDGQRNGAAR